jgi:uncharacterized membrane protein YhaH (DUF805 family)
VHPLLISGASRFLALLLLQNNDDAAGALGACGCLGFVGFIIFAFFAINIAILVWVARDAKSRGMDSSVLWMILVMLTGLIGLIIYVLSRPQGNLMVCQHCGNKRLQASAKCPHCGNA